MRKLLTALLLCALLLGLSAPALAFSDLPEDHWAYATMTKAAQVGILTGYEDGTMHPGDSLSWGQCLVMLGRAFYPPTLAKYPFVDGQHWAKPAYDAAMSLTVLEQADFLPVSLSALDAPIKRQDAAVLVSRVLQRVFEADLSPSDPTAAGLSDFGTLAEPYRAGVLQCVSLGVITGTDDGCFLGGDTLTRAAGAAILVRALALVEESPDDDAPLPQQPGDVVLPPADSVVTPGPLTAMGQNAQKLIHLYGTDAMTRYPSKEEADAHMTTVTVPVWRLDKSTGAKTSNALSFRIHSSIANDMISIFTEIYNDPEQFPIYSIGGYDWRGTTGEHNCGTALDINYLENYQIYPDGRIGAGECWLPGENPFSIPENGSVVRVFNAHGYSWGGNAWPSYSNKDYMHFSYLGG